MNLKDHISKEKKVKFSHYCQNELWYRTEEGLLFPVPISDTGNATFLAEDKSIYFMRYIRKHLEYLENARREQETI